MAIDNGPFVVKESPLPWHVVYIDGDQELVSLADNTGKHIAHGLTEQDARLVRNAVTKDREDAHD